MKREPIRVKKGGKEGEKGGMIGKSVPGLLNLQFNIVWPLLSTPDLAEGADASPDALVG